MILPAMSKVALGLVPLMMMFILRARGSIRPLHFKARIGWGSDQRALGLSSSLFPNGQTHYIWGMVTLALFTPSICAASV